MKAKFIYDLILPYFVGNDDDLHPQQKRVHRGKNGYLYATNGHIAIRMEQKKVCRQYDEIPNFPNVEKILQGAIERKDNKKAVIKTDDLVRLLAYAVWKREECEDECEECDGKGVIKCEHCESEYDCKKCDGKGYENIYIKEFSLIKNRYRYIIKIGMSTYVADYLYIVALTAMMLQIDEITYLYEDKNKGVVFSFDELDIILMPTTDDTANMEMILL
jgi:hypothetical protein